ncbi:hypothetical protein BURKHO8Y_210361 [Burkholderia sp. 8Y]|nr:hypothetical protein BURKHO8Y_210361 [Burkholderia sp. 8Y]
MANAGAATAEAMTMAGTIDLNMIDLHISIERDVAGTLRGTASSLKRSVGLLVLGGNPYSAKSVLTARH